jgi:hypothetical protein
MINILIYCYVDKYIGVLIFIIIISQYKIALKEFFQSEDYSATPTLPSFLQPISERALGPTSQYSFNTDDKTQNLLKQQLGIDDRFKFDEVIKDDILRQIKSQIDFDPYKSNLAKDVIYELYNKYYDNNIFVKLKQTVDDSQQYVAAGNFTYLPKSNKVDYDLITYQNLNDNVQFGVNPIVDGIANRTRGT